VAGPTCQKKDISRFFLVFNSSIYRIFLVTLPKTFGEALFEKSINSFSFFVLADYENKTLFLAKIKHPRWLCAFLFKVAFLLKEIRNCLAVNCSERGWVNKRTINNQKG
jgi:hypothetical protein